MKWQILYLMCSGLLRTEISALAFYEGEGLTELTELTQRDYCEVSAQGSITLLPATVHPQLMPVREKKHGANRSWNWNIKFKTEFPGVFRSMQ